MAGTTIGSLLSKTQKYWEPMIDFVLKKNITSTKTKALSSARLTSQVKYYHQKIQMAANKNYENWVCIAPGIYYKKLRHGGDMLFQVDDTNTGHQLALRRPEFEKFILQYDAQPSEPPIGSPKYKAGDIVYFIPKPSNAAGESYPSIGSNHEIDCKILDSTWYGKNKTYYYTLITGRGKTLDTIFEKCLVSANERHLYSGEGYKTLKENTELCPEGTIFSKIGEYYGNESLGIYIHVRKLNNELKHLFK